jgi:hypothetical protein
MCFQSAICLTILIWRVSKGDGKLAVPLKYRSTEAHPSDKAFSQRLFSLLAGTVVRICPERNRNMKSISQFRYSCSTPDIKPCLYRLEMLLDQNYWHQMFLLVSKCISQSKDLPPSLLNKMTTFLLMPRIQEL